MCGIEHKVANIKATLNDEAIAHLQRRRAQDNGMMMIRVPSRYPGLCYGVHA